MNDYTELDRTRDAVSLVNGIDPFQNPWAKAGFNLAKQGEIVRADPARARELIKAAGGDPTAYGLEDSDAAPGQ